MKNTIESSIHWREMNQEEMLVITGGNWWSDFKLGFSEGFNWAWGVIKDTETYPISSSSFSPTNTMRGGLNGLVGFRSELSKMPSTCRVSPFLS